MPRPICRSRNAVTTGGEAAPQAGRVGGALLSGAPAVPGALSLEPGASRVLHRPPVSSARGLAGDLRSSHPHGHPHGETRQRGHLSGSQAEPSLPRGDRESLPHPHRRHTDQAHHGTVWLKMYEKFGLILRIETTVNDVSFFPHYRTVEQRGGRNVTRWARMKKS